jgi:hypothetical protein
MDSKDDSSGKETPIRVYACYSSWVLMQKKPNMRRVLRSMLMPGSRPSEIQSNATQKKRPTTLNMLKPIAPRDAIIQIRLLQATRHERK